MVLQIEHGHWAYDYVATVSGSPGGASCTPDCSETIAITSASTVLRAIGNALFSPATVTADLTLTGNSQTDYLIGQAGFVDSTGTGGSGSLTFSWRFTGWPNNDPDHHAGSVGDEICDPVTTATGAASCTMAPQFLKPHDVGTWTIELTVTDGTITASDSLEIQVKGFEYDEKRPGNTEALSNVNPINTWNGDNDYGIRPDDWNVPALLEYTQFAGVTYQDDETGIYAGEDHYMQPQLARIFERLAELTTAEGLDLMVNDAWDGDGAGHSPTSRHYEGRALDLDLPAEPNAHNDQAQLGRLAYLVEKVFAEFGLTEPDGNNDQHGWFVWHERNHVHVSLNGPQAQPWEWGYQCDPGPGPRVRACLDHQWAATYDLAGAAVGSMITRRNSAQGIDTNTFYANAGAPSGGIDCDTMASVLNEFYAQNSPYACVKESSRERAMRTVAFWLDWTNDNLGASLPAAVPLQPDHPNYDYRNWVAVEGAIAMQDPSAPGNGSREDPTGGAYRVGGFFVDDPGILDADSAKRFHLDRLVEHQLVVIQSLEIMFQPTFDGDFEVLVPACAEDGSSAAKRSANALAAIAAGCGTAPTVYIESPTDVVVAGESQTVVVRAPLGATNVRLAVDDASQPQESYDNLSTWKFRWVVPAAVGAQYELKAFAMIDGTEKVSDAVIVTSIEGTSGEEIQVTIIHPEANTDAELNKSITVKVQVSAPASAQIERVELRVNSGQPQTRTSEPWEFNLTPTTLGANFLDAVVFHDGGIEGPKHSITVYAEDKIEPAIVSPASGSKITWNRLVRILAIAPPDAPSLDIELSGNGFVIGTLPGINVYSSLDEVVWEFDWWPQGTVGDYQLQLVESFNPDQKLGDPIILTVTVEFDQTEPTVIFLQPENGQVVRGRYPVLVKATDNHAIESIQLVVTNTDRSQLVRSPTDRIHPLRSDVLPVRLEPGRRWQLPAGSGGDGYLRQCRYDDCQCGSAARRQRRGAQYRAGEHPRHHC